MALWFPNFNAIKRTSNDNFGAQNNTGVLAKFFFEVDAPLTINGHLNGVCSKSALLIAVHFARAHLFQHFVGNLLKSLSGQNINALVSTKCEITTWLEAGSERSRERKSTLGVELSLMHSNKHANASLGGNTPLHPAVTLIPTFPHCQPPFPIFLHFCPHSPRSSRPPARKRKEKSTERWG